MVVRVAATVTWSHNPTSIPRGVMASCRRSPSTATRWARSAAVPDSDANRRGIVGMAQSFQFGGLERCLERRAFLPLARTASKNQDLSRYTSRPTERPRKLGPGVHRMRLWCAPVFFTSCAQVLLLSRVRPARSILMPRQRRSTTTTTTTAASAGSSGSKKRARESAGSAAVVDIEECALGLAARTEFRCGLLKW